MRGAGAELENRQVGRTEKGVEKETLETWTGNSEEKEKVRGRTTGLSRAEESDGDGGGREKGGKQALRKRQEPSQPAGWPGLGHC